MAAETLRRRMKFLAPRKDHKCPVLGSKLTKQTKFHMLAKFRKHVIDLYRQAWSDSRA